MYMYIYIHTGCVAVETSVMTEIHYATRVLTHKSFVIDHMHDVPKSEMQHDAET